MNESRVKSKYIADKEKVLKEFGIIVTPEIHEKLSELYPRDIPIENYTRKIILDHLNKLTKK